MLSEGEGGGKGEGKGEGEGEGEGRGERERARVKASLPKLAAHLLRRILAEVRFGARAAGWHGAPAAAARDCFSGHRRADPERHLPHRAGGLDHLHAQFCHVRVCSQALRQPTRVEADNEIGAGLQA